MATSNKRDLLVYGFVREIEHILGDNKIIPLGLIQICCAFYSIPFKIFVMLNEFNSQSLIHVADIEKKSFSDLVIDADTNKTETFKAACYVPDISSMIKISDDNIDGNKCYDGIVSICEMIVDDNDDDDDGYDDMLPFFRRHHYCASVILFESNKIEQERINYDIFASSEAVPDSAFMGLMNNDLIYCDNRQSVVYEYFGTIYEMKLKNIDLGTKSFNFKELTANDESYRNASIGYIHNENKIFLMDGIGFHIIDDMLSHKILSKKSKCGIFDMLQQEWKYGKQFEYNMYNDDPSFQTGICEKNIYDTNKIFIVSTRGHTATYDINKDEWTMLYCNLDNKDTRFGSAPLVWMYDNPHVLYCSDYPYFGYFDIRDHVAKWNKHQEMQFINDKLKGFSWPVLFI